MSKNKRKLLVIGWDAADWKAINPLIEKGAMPNLEKMISEGVKGNLSTLDPPLSPMLWTSIATGKRPYKHGILGFTEPKKDNSGIQPVLNTSRKCKAIWNILMQEGYKTHSIGWWPSHPAEPINGVYISNFYQKAFIPKEDQVLDAWPLMANTVHPAKDALKYAALRVHPWELTEAHLHPFLPKIDSVDLENKAIIKGINSVRKIISDCSSIHSAASYILENEEWDFLAVYYDAIDHFGHGFMKFHPPKRDFIPQPFYDAFYYVVEAGYRYHDMMLGNLLSQTDDDTTVILISDHGFHPDHMRPDVIPKVPAGPALEHNPLGIIVAKGPGIRKNEQIYGASLIDITPTILSLYDLPIGEDMDGKVLKDVYLNDKQDSYIKSWEDVDGDSGMHPKESLNDPFIDQSAMDQLIELGYIDKPDENAEKAIANTLNECNYWLALAYIDGNKLNEALPILEELFTNNTDQIRYGFTLVNVYRKKNQFNKAKQILNILKGNSKLNGPNIKVLEATILQLENKNQEALELLLSAESSSKKNNYEIYLHIAYNYMKLKKWGDAERAFETTLKIDPANHSAYYGLGYCAYMQTEYQKSIDYFIESISILYYQPKAHYLLAESLLKCGDQEGAAIAYEEFMKFEEKNSNTIVGINKALEDLNISNNSDSLKDQFEIKSEKEIIVVSGLPRSGTSMMMQILNKGGIPPFTDDKRKADENNQKGYFEHEAIKSLLRDNSILKEVNGQAVKIITQLTYALPLKYNYKIIFMKRPIEDILSSQTKMLGRLGKEPKNDKNSVGKSYINSIKRFQKWSTRMPNVDVMYVDYNNAISDPQTILTRISDFLSDYKLDMDKMGSAINSSLRREHAKAE